MTSFKQFIETNIPPEEVIQLIQNSPQTQGRNIDWEQYANRWGLRTHFAQGKMSVADLVNLVNNFRVRLSKDLSQDNIATKTESGNLNPIILTMPPNEPQPLAVVDGSHSLVAAHNRKQETVDVIASLEAIKWLGDMWKNF